MNYFPGKLAGRRLMIIIVAEVALMGGGRLIPSGPITPRMFLFSIALIWTLWQLLTGKTIRIETVLVTLYFICLMFLGIFEGLMDHAQLSSILTDIKPLSYFLILPFLELTIQSREDIQAVEKVMRYCGLGLAAGYLLVCALQLIGVISPILLYAALSVVDQGGSQEFVARVNPATSPLLLFSYKGFLFIGVAAILWVKIPKRGKIYAGICVFAALLTLVRGYLVALGVVWISYVLLFEKRKALRSFGVTLLFLCAVGALYIFGIHRSSGAVEQSDSVRVETIQQVADRETPVSAIVGHGLGVGVPIRPHGMEITYLQVYHQEGILGILFWCYFILSGTYYIWRISRNGGDADAILMYLLLILVYVESATNPILNNPIGMSVVMISFVALRLLHSEKVESLTRQRLSLHSKHAHSTNQINRYDVFFGDA